METETDLLKSIFDHWRENAAEAERVLGKEKAHFFVDIYNDALDIKFALSDAYPNEEVRSLTCGLVIGLWKEIHWLMVMFLAGNYPLLLGRLRFIWELVFRALEADCCEQESGPTVDDKHEWLARNEKSMGWRTPILPLLERLFPMDNQKEIENCFKPTWDTLNCYVHPSAILRDDLIEESGLLFRDAFDEKLANKALHYATEVFELVWLAVLWRFPKAKPRLLSDPNVFKKCPRVRAMLEKSQGPFP